jgi:hypothetical protein
MPLGIQEKPLVNAKVFFAYRESIWRFEGIVLLLLNLGA